MESPQKGKVELSYDLAKPLLDTYPKEWKSAYNTDSCTPMFTAAHSQLSSYGISLGTQQLMDE
jgi:hypothetical protein